MHICIEIIFTEVQTFTVFNPVTFLISFVQYIILTLFFLKGLTENIFIAICRHCYNINVVIRLNVSLYCCPLRIYIPYVTLTLIQDRFY